jgi:hypothetical protein
VIILLLLNFDENPFAFSILLLFPLGFLLFSRTSRIILTANCLLIEHSNLIKRFSKIVKIDIDQIERIDFVNEFKPIGRTTLPMGYMLSKSAQLNIRLRDSNTITQAQVGTRNQFITLVENLRKIVDINNAKL